jgi:hypothetical protein
MISHPNKAHPSEGRFSPTSLETACPRKYLFEKVIGLRKKGVANYLNMGSSIHAFVEEWQRARLSGLSGNELLAEGVNKALPLATSLLPSWPGDAYSIENWLFTCEGYHSRWENDGKFPVQLETISWIPMENGTLLGGVMDSLFERPNGSLLIRDTKTSGRPATDWFWNGMINKFQLSMYYVMVSKLFPDRDILGVEVDMVTISKKREKGEDNYQRRLFERTDLQINDAINTYNKKTQFITEGLKLNEHDRPAYFYQEQSQCSSYGGCSFLPLCIHGLNHPSVHTDFQLGDTADSDGD